MALYEILIRFNDSGSLQGAHAQYLTNGMPGPAVPLSLVDDADKPTLAAAMGEATTAALAKAEAADTARKNAEARFAEVAGENIEALKADNAAKDANIQALLAKVADLEALAESQTKDADPQP